MSKLILTKQIIADDRFVFQIQTSTTNQNVLIPLSDGYSYDYLVNWGDDTSSYVTSYDDADASHYYATAGTYTVYIDGTFGSIYTGGSGNFLSSLTKIVNWGNTGLQRVCLWGCASLNELPNQSMPSTVTGVYTLFGECSKLTTVPNLLFSNCTGITSFNSAFSYCSSLNAIPSGLFNNNINAEHFSSTFSSCISLTSIPSGLFDYTTKVTNFSTTFSGCSNLTSIPSSLFMYDVSVTSFSGTFYQCVSLNEIPGYPLFDNNLYVTNFSSIFSGCTKLTAIPPEMFDNCPNVTNFDYAFYDCSNLAGSAPTLWTRVPAPSGTDCFYNCASLSNYASIPAAWK